ncbi:MAG: hypothetical protein ACXU8N_02590 [Telluria sp.]
MTRLLAALCCGLACAAAQATAIDKTAYEQRVAEAKTAYKEAKAHCASLAGNARDVCVAEAKANYVRAEQDATAQYKDTLKAWTRARMRIASANYDLDRAKCGALGGNDKDVCLQQAKATRVTAESAAKADNRTLEARAEARDDQRTAEYKVALEKCDAYAGAAKDQCVQAAKAQYGR